MLHRRIVGDQRAGVVRHRREHGGDQFGIGRQRDEFLGAGGDRHRRPPRIGIDAAGDDRHRDVLALIGLDQGADVELVVDHQQIGALAPAQGFGGLDYGLDMGDAGAGFHGHLDRGGELAAQFSND